MLFIRPLNRLNSYWRFPFCTYKKNVLMKSKHVEMYDAYDEYLIRWICRFSTSLIGKNKINVNTTLCFGSVICRTTVRLQNTWNSTGKPLVNHLSSLTTNERVLDLFFRFFFRLFFLWACACFRKKFTLKQTSSFSKLFFNRIRFNVVRFSFFR